MAEFIFWYFVVGVALIFLYGITTITGMFLKYPVNDVSEAIDRVHKEYRVSSNNIVEGIWQFIIGCVCWPIRLSDAPGITELVWDECEKIKAELENKD